MEGKMTIDQQGEKNQKNEQRVLILDDQPEIVELIELVVKSHYKCQVDTTINGEAALELCNQNYYNLVCADYIMPGMNGDEFVKKLRSGASKNKDTPVIIVTGNDLELGDKVNDLENVRVLKKVEPVQHILEILSKYLKI